MIQDAVLVGVGQAVLVAGTVTVRSPKINAQSIVILSAGVTGGTPGDLYVGTITPGASFVITSTSNTDTSTVNFAVFQPGE